MKSTTARIAVLDGVRAYAILIIMGFHLWQQSWMQYVLPSDLFSFLGIENFSLVWVPRTGYMLVDVLLLLSAFCLFLPYAQQMIDPDSRRPDDLWSFYKKRLVRILPPYYLCIAFFAVFCIQPSDYASASLYWKDLLAHLTFTHTFSEFSYFSTKFPTTLWTLCVEMQFYLLFPLIAHFFKKYPAQTWLVMVVCAEAFIAFFARTESGGADSFLINQLPAFFGVFANGMLGAYFCVFLHSRKDTLSVNSVKRLGTGFAVLFLGMMICMLKNGLNHAENIQRWQVDFRFLFSAVACLFILALDHAHRGVQWLFSAKPVRFIAAVSYNLYIWHAPVMLWMKTLRIPYYPDAPENAAAWPQSASGEAWHATWQTRYVLLFWVFSIVLAAALTYAFEEPVRKLLLKRKIKT